MASYSNFRALTALVKASLQSIFKSPSAVFFGIGFPLVFILVFGFLGGGGNYSIKVAVSPGSDTNNGIYQALRQIPVLRWDTLHNAASEHNALADGNIVASIHIKPNPGGEPKYFVDLNTTGEEQAKVQQLQSMIRQVTEHMDPEIQQRMDAIAKVEVRQIEFREYKTIDFILPGQLGFSLLSGSIFGTAFVFFNMRQTLVLKRFFATPVRREVIILSEGIARMLFQLLSAVIIIGLGHYAFQFTLLHGFVTFLELILLSIIAILVFMAIGFIISGVVKSDASIPMFANLITLPQVFLAGTFFPTDSFPKWLQTFSYILPLKYLNDAMRKVSYDGAGLWDIKLELGVLLGFGVLFYFIAGRVFKWE